MKKYRPLFRYFFEPCQPYTSGSPEIRRLPRRLAKYVSGLEGEIKDLYSEVVPSLVGLSQEGARLQITRDTVVYYQPGEDISLDGKKKKLFRWVLTKFRKLTAEERKLIVGGKSPRAKVVL